MHETYTPYDPNDPINITNNARNEFQYSAALYNEELFSKILLRIINKDNYSQYNSLRIYTSNPLSLNMSNAVIKLHGELVEFYVILPDGTKVRYR